MPDLADRTHDDFVPRLFGQHLESGALAGGAETVDADLGGAGFATQAFGQCTKREQRANQRGTRQVLVAHELPDA